MTDPRMTPTNDAPVTVEQLAQRKAVNTVFADLLLPLIPDLADRMERGNAACTLILDRLAALAPAPAGDGVEAALKFALTVKAELVERAPTYSIQSVEREHFDRAILAIAALARPRAAVGEGDPGKLRDRVMYDDQFQAACQRYAHGGGSSAAIAAAAILALQSPPAKVEE